MARKFLLQGEVNNGRTVVMVYVAKRTKATRSQPFVNLFTPSVGGAQRYDTPADAARELRRHKADPDTRWASLRVVPEPVT